MKTTDWPEVMKEVTFVFNSTKNSSTILSPHEIMYGVSLRSPQSVTLSDTGAYVSPEDHVDEFQATRPGIYRRVWDNNSQARRKSKQYYDRARVTPQDRKVQVGDKVMVSFGEGNPA
ncbi:hypothetical protein FJT64_000126 [Amphibalanus amphitrite]|uniref:Uncharacterized protein n=1 Tax=Amphibalanus amphitrite TaxID=1232801 RepID=A0A6A4VYA8_AMPAM|nr:hypothetical protein FJT64_000126 [Amphibalanus amphitrite]